MKWFIINIQGDGVQNDKESMLGEEGDADGRICFRFHTYNSSRQSETVAALTTNGQLTEESLFARPPDQRTPRVSVQWYSFGRKIGRGEVKELVPSEQ